MMKKRHVKGFLLSSDATVLARQMCGNWRSICDSFQESAQSRSVTRPTEGKT